VKWENCPSKSPIDIKVILPRSNVDYLKINGHIDVKENIPGDLYGEIESTRCTLDKSSCERYTNNTIKDICKRIDENEAAFSKHLDPPLLCPIKPGNYALVNASFDLSLISMVPLDGYTWLVTFKLVTLENGLKKTLMCLNSETKVIKTSRKS